MIWYGDINLGYEYAVFIRNLCLKSSSVPTDKVEGISEVGHENVAPS
jgi:hypothetical protein